MGRLVRGVILTLLFATWVGSEARVTFAQTSSVEERAALLLFKEGKDLYKDGNYRAALERFDTASKVVKKEVLTFYLGMSYAKLGNHQAALFYLSPLAGKVPKDAEAQRQAVEIKALWFEANRFLKSDDCVRAYPWLVRLRGRLSASEERKRAEHETHCSGRSTAFSVKTSREKAAHEIFLEAQRFRDMGRLERASELFQKTRSLVDDLLVHEETFEVLVRLGRWREAANVAEPIGELWLASDGHGYEFQSWWLWLQICSDFAPLGELKGAAALHYLTDLTKVLKEAEGARVRAKARLRGEPRVDAGPFDLSALDGAHLETLHEVLVAGQSSQLLGLWLDTLVAVKSCSSYLKVRTDVRFRRIVPQRHRAPDERCVPKVVERSGAPVSASVVAKERPSHAVLGWSLVGGGVLLAAGSGYFAYLQSNHVSKMEGFSGDYNALGDLDKRSEAGQELVSRAQGAQSLAKKDQTWALIFGGASIVSVGVGVYFLVTERRSLRGPDEALPKTKKGVEWMPVLTPNGGGIYGRF